MLNRNAPALLIAAALLYCSGCVCTHSSMYGPGCGITSCGGCGDCGDCGMVACEPACGCGLDSCSSGCGEVYWGEWTNHPPDVCDPCNNCGDYVGGGVCCDPCWTPWSLISGLRHLWGYRYMPACGIGACGGCDSCGGMPMSEDVIYMDGDVSMPTHMKGGETIVLPEPEPAAAPTKAASLKRRVRHTGQVRIARR